MKRIGIILICFMVFITSCYKEDINPIPPPKPIVDIFTQSEASISDGDEVMFKLVADGDYILKLVDKSTNQTISKEKISGKLGENKIKIYTKTLQSKYLYLVLENVDKKEINKTNLIIN
jgi:hypothetical protein